MGGKLTVPLILGVATFQCIDFWFVCCHSIKQSCAIIWGHLKDVARGSIWRLIFSYSCHYGERERQKGLWMSGMNQYTVSDLVWRLRSGYLWKWNSRPNFSFAFPKSHAWSDWSQKQESNHSCDKQSIWGQFFHFLRSNVEIVFGAKQAFTPPCSE